MIIIFISIGLLMLIFGIWSPRGSKFSTSKSRGFLYSYGFYARIRVIFAGLVFFIIGLSVLFGKYLPFAENKQIGISLLIVAILFAAISISIYFSDKANTLAWKFLLHGHNPDLDRKYLITGCAIVSFGLFFGFYVFYWG